MNSTTLTLSTSELREGDVVICHGLRCLIDRPLEVSTAHPGYETRWTQALVLNRDEVPNEIVPVHWTSDWKRNARDEARPHDGEHRWTIQGNDLARWSVERAPASLKVQA